MMKHFLKIPFFTVIGVVSFLTATYLVIGLKGKSIVAGQLENITHKKVSIGYFRAMPSLSLELRDLQIEGLVKADYIFISPSILSFLTGNIGFNEIKLIKPEINYEKLLPPPAQTPAAETPAAETPAAETPAVGTPPVEAPVAETPAAAPTPAEQPPATVVSSIFLQTTMPKQGIRLPLIIKHLNVTDGTINLFDRTAGTEGIKITVKDISFNLTNLNTAAHSAVTNFEFSGNIPWQAGEEEGKVTAEGWIDLFKKDTRASLKISGIDGVYLYPYYSQWVDLEKARIQKAKLNFTSNINGLNNDITAECHLELSDIVFKERTPEEKQEKAERIAYAVLDIFKALDQGKIVLDFTIRTKMDRPQFGFAAIKGAVEDKLASRKKAERPLVGDVFALPIRLLQGAVKATSDLSKATVDGAFAVGNEVKKAVEDSFKKEK